MCKNNGKMNIALFAAAVLLCLTLFTTHLTSGLYARYTTSASGSDSARVAKWDIQLGVVHAEPKSFVGNMDENFAEVLNYVFTIGSDSEVAAKYSITVQFSDADGKGLDASIIPAIAGAAVTANDARTRFTFTNDAWTFPAGTTTHDHTLTLTRTYFQNDQMPAAFNDVTVTISVLAEQID